MNKHETPNRVASSTVVSQQIADCNEAYRRLSREKQKEMQERILVDVPHEYVRDWLIAEGSAFKTKTEPTVILHMPSGLWKGFRLPYDVAVEMLKSKPDADGELIELIYAV